LNIAPEAGSCAAPSVPVVRMPVGMKLKDLEGETIALQCFNCNAVTDFFYPCLFELGMRCWECQEVDDELSEADIDALAEIFDLLARYDTENKKSATEAVSSSINDGDTAPGADQDASVAFTAGQVGES
jgi:hypothetical protein